MGADTQIQEGFIVSEPTSPAVKRSPVSDVATRIQAQQLTVARVADKPAAVQPQRVVRSRQASHYIASGRDIDNDALSLASRRLAPTPGIAETAERARQQPSVSATKTVEVPTVALARSLPPPNHPSRAVQPQDRVCARRYHHENVPVPLSAVGL